MSWISGLAISVPVDRPLDRPHETKRVRYRVHLDGDDPAKVFPSGSTQQVRPIDANTAEVTVYAVRPGGPANPEAKPEEPTRGDRDSNNFIQSDHPKVVAAAKEGAGGQTDPWAVAVALEAHARRLIPNRDYTQAFDTAPDAFHSGRGDCTEHAVLLAALARAAKDSRPGGDGACLPRAEVSLSHVDGGLYQRPLGPARRHARPGRNRRRSSATRPQQPRRASRAIEHPARGPGRRAVED